MSDKAPAYQWYPKDYESDEAVKLMTYEQEGIYRRLLDHQALHGGIPADVRQIAMLCPKVPAKRFLALWLGIAGKFTEVGGKLVNQKLERVKAGTAKYKADKAAAGRASAEQRAEQHGNSQPNRRPIEKSTAAEPATATASSTASASAEHTIARVGPAFRTDGAAAGMHPKDHMKHAACDDTFSRCVPTAVHSKLCDLLAPKHGGDRQMAGDALKAWYPAVWATLPAEFVMGEAFKFWQAHFDAAFASVDVVSGRKPLFTTTVEESGKAVLAILHRTGGVPR